VIRRGRPVLPQGRVSWASFPTNSGRLSGVGARAAGLERGDSVGIAALANAPITFSALARIRSPVARIRSVRARDSASRPSRDIACGVVAYCHAKGSPNAQPASCGSSYGGENPTSSVSFSRCCAET
jgi:hypothetical protein